jgi:hypothetical protein
VIDIWVALDRERVGHVPSALAGTTFQIGRFSGRPAPRVRRLGWSAVRAAVMRRFVIAGLVLLAVGAMGRAAAGAAALR